MEESNHWRSMTPESSDSEHIFSRRNTPSPERPRSLAFPPTDKPKLLIEWMPEGTKPTNNHPAVMNTEANGKGDRCWAPEDFDGDKTKYKTWFTSRSIYGSIPSSLPEQKCQNQICTLLHDLRKRAADWAEHFTDTHIKTDKNRKRYFDAGMKWAEFVLLLNRTFLTSEEHETKLKQT